MMVKDFMTSELVSVTLDTTLAKVNALFAEHSFHHLLVVEDLKLLGVITDRDLFKSLSPRVDASVVTDQDLAYLNKKAHQIMTRNPITLHASANFREAIHVFNCERVSCIPVINDRNHPVGIITWRDLMRVLDRS